MPRGARRRLLPGGIEPASQPQARMKKGREALCFPPFLSLSV
ncbi:hypothetical protein ABIC78_000159 [Novosphingobium sp. 1529]|nr:hypothetical protein C8K11_105140 [Novosphingobium sp. GV055]PUB04112.1 hypothetical protein C8K12_105140 [Novosphingobium sp. GV061]PUB20503.1 hypothetical protein C8K14_105140 [Novosphingobium sp. GV079]PUB42229.1 hypothetical protein C8K10_105140 [Novosphingobium sp. GV027]